MWESRTLCLRYSRERIFSPQPNYISQYSLDYLIYRVVVIVTWSSLQETALMMAWSLKCRWKRWKFTCQQIPSSPHWREREREKQMYNAGKTHLMNMWMGDVIISMLIPHYCRSWLSLPHAAQLHHPHLSVCVFLDLNEHNSTTSVLFIWKYIYMVNNKIYIKNFYLLYFAMNTKIIKHLCAS